MRAFVAEIGKPEVPEANTCLAITGTAQSRTVNKGDKYLVVTQGNPARINFGSTDPVWGSAGYGMAVPEGVPFVITMPDATVRWIGPGTAGFITFLRIVNR